MTPTSRTGYENVSVDLLAAPFLTFTGFPGLHTGQFRSVRSGQLACPEAVEGCYNQFSKLNKAQLGLHSCSHIGRVGRLMGLQLTSHDVTVITFFAPSLDPELFHPLKGSVGITGDIICKGQHTINGCASKQTIILVLPNPTSGHKIRSFYMAVHT